jgi:hypothetical protein
MNRQQRRRERRLDRKRDTLGRGFVAIAQRAAGLVNIVRIDVSNLSEVPDSYMPLIWRFVAGCVDEAVGGTPVQCLFCDNEFRPGGIAPAHLVLLCARGDERKGGMVNGICPLCADRSYEAIVDKYREVYGDMQHIDPAHLGPEGRA